MTGVETAIQEELQHTVEQLDTIRTRLEEVHARLPVAPDETAMLEGGRELDFSIGVRSAIECVLTDHIGPAIRDLAAAASYRPRGKAPE